jgi:integrase
MGIEDIDAVHPANAYLLSLDSQRSRATMRDDLALIAALVLGIDPASVTADQRRALIFDVPWHVLDLPRANAIRAALVKRGQSHHTTNRQLCALRGVLEACWQQDLMTGEAYYKARSVKAVKGETLPAGRSITEGEMKALFSVCAIDPTPAGARDAALFACADAGLRRAEIAALDLADFEPDGARLKTHGKGNKDRLVPVNDGQARALADWLAIRGDAPGALLWPVNKAGKLTPRRMTSQAVYNAMRKRGQEAGVTDFSPLDFRRTLVGDLLDAGADIATVQKIMGHADPGTTARYDRRPESAKRKAMNLRPTPYKGRRQPMLF